MSYSIQTVFPDCLSRDRMWSFITKHYRDWETLMGLSDDEPRYISRPTKKTSYGLRGYLIGFDYKGVNESRTYVWHICCWMAKMNNILTVNYDGCQAISIDEISLEKTEIVTKELERLSELWLYPL